MNKKKSVPNPKPDDVLRRMLNTPPHPHKPKPAPATDALSAEEIEELRRVKREQLDHASEAFKKKTGH